jgi:hypothetical protein
MLPLPVEAGDSLEPVSFKKTMYLRYPRSYSNIPVDGVTDGAGEGLRPPKTCPNFLRDSLTGMTSTNILDRKNRCNCNSSDNGRGRKL